MSKGLHVVYILTKLELGGAQKVCLTLFDGVRKLGVTSSLISGSDGVLVCEATRFDSVFFLESFKREVGFKNFFRDVKAFFEIISLLKTIKKKYSNVIVHTHSTKAGLLGRFAALFAGVKIRIHTVHGYGFNDYQSKLKWFVIYLAELFTSFITTNFICVSKQDIDTGKKLFPNFSKKHTLIRAAVDWEKFYNSKLDKSDLHKEFVFGTICCFKPQKNLFDLLEAFRIVYVNSPNQNNLKLQIIGDGILRPNIESWILQNNMTDKIQLLGWQHDVSKIIPFWDCYVMSSLWEGLPCSIIEARLSKLPIIAYSVGGISEVIFDGKNGFLIKPKDINLLASRMLSLLEDEKLRKKLASFKDDLYDFKNSKMIQQHLILYRSCL